MNNRELVAVFWGTVAAIPVILALVWAVNLGLEAQKREQRRETLDELTREANEDLDAYRDREIKTEAWDAVRADLDTVIRDFETVRARHDHSPAAPVDSGFATRATDSTRPTAGETL